MSKDCYFYVPEQDVPEADQKISPLCLKCKHKYQIKTGWFWEGSNLGYGPWLYRCHICDYVIHDPNQEEHEEIETTN